MPPKLAAAKPPSGRSPSPAAGKAGAKAKGTSPSPPSAKEGNLSPPKAAGKAKSKSPARQKAAAAAPAQDRATPDQVDGAQLAREIEKINLEHQKTKADQEKQRKADITNAKKALGKETAAIKKVYKKQEQKIKKFEQTISKLEKAELQANDKRKKVDEAMEEKIRSSAEKRKNISVEVQEEKDSCHLIEARLQYLENLEQMLGLAATASIGAGAGSEDLLMTHATALDYSGAAHLLAATGGEGSDSRRAQFADSRRGSMNSDDASTGMPAVSDIDSGSDAQGTSEADGSEVPEIGHLRRSLKTLDRVLTQTGLDMDEAALSEDREYNDYKEELAQAKEEQRARFQGKLDAAKATEFKLRAKLEGARREEQRMETQIAQLEAMLAEAHESSRAELANYQSLHNRFGYYDEHGDWHAGEENVEDEEEGGVHNEHRCEHLDDPFNQDHHSDPKSSKRGSHESVPGAEQNRGDSSLAMAAANGSSGADVEGRRRSSTRDPNTPAPIAAPSSRGGSIVEGGTAEAVGGSPGCSDPASGSTYGAEAHGAAAHGAAATVPDSNGEHSASSNANANTHNHNSKDDSNIDIGSSSNNNDTIRRSPAGTPSIDNDNNNHNNNNNMGKTGNTRNIGDSNSSHNEADVSGHPDGDPARRSLATIAAAASAKEDGEGSTGGRPSLHRAPEEGGASSPYHPGHSAPDARLLVPTPTAAPGEPDDMPNSSSGSALSTGGRRSVPGSGEVPKPALAPVDEAGGFPSQASSSSSSLPRPLPPPGAAQSDSAGQSGILERLGAHNLGPIGESALAGYALDRTNGRALGQSLGPPDSARTGMSSAASDWVSDWDTDSKVGQSPGRGRNAADDRALQGGWQPSFATNQPPGRGRPPRTEETALLESARSQSGENFPHNLDGFATGGVDRGGNGGKPSNVRVPGLWGGDEDYPAAPASPSSRGRGASPSTSERRPMSPGLLSAAAALAGGVLPVTGSRAPRGAERDDDGSGHRGGRLSFGQTLLPGTAPAENFDARAGAGAGGSGGTGTGTGGGTGGGSGPSGGPPLGYRTSTSSNSPYLSGSGGHVASTSGSSPRIGPGAYTSSPSVGGCSGQDASVRPAGSPSSWGRPTAGGCPSSSSGLPEAADRGYGGRGIGGSGHPGSSLSPGRDGQPSLGPYGSDPRNPGYGGDATFAGANTNGSIAIGTSTSSVHNKIGGVTGSPNNAPTSSFSPYSGMAGGPSSPRGATQGSPSLGGSSRDPAAPPWSSSIADAPPWAATKIEGTAESGRGAWGQHPNPLASWRPSSGLPSSPSSQPSFSAGGTPGSPRLPAPRAVDGPAGWQSAVNVGGSGYTPSVPLTGPAVGSSARDSPSRGWDAGKFASPVAGDLDRSPGSSRSFGASWDSSTMAGNLERPGSALGSNLVPAGDSSLFKSPMESTSGTTRAAGSSSGCRPDFARPAGSPRDGPASPTTCWGTPQSDRSAPDLKFGATGDYGSTGLYNPGRFAPSGGSTSSPLAASPPASGYMGFNRSFSPRSPIPTTGSLASPAATTSGPAATAAPNLTRPSDLTSTAGLAGLMGDPQGLLEAPGEPVQASPPALSSSRSPLPIPTKAAESISTAVAQLQGSHLFTSTSPRYEHCRLGSQWPNSSS